MPKITLFIRQRNGSTGFFMSASILGKYVPKRYVRHSTYPISETEYYNVYIKGQDWPTDEGKYNVFFKDAWVDERYEVINAHKHVIYLKDDISFEKIGDCTANTGNNTPFEKKPEKKSEVIHVDSTIDPERLKPIEEPKKQDIEEDLPF